MAVATWKKPSWSKCWSRLPRISEYRVQRRRMSKTYSKKLTRMVMRDCRGTVSSDVGRNSSSSLSRFWKWWQHRRKDDYLHTIIQQSIDRWLLRHLIRPCISTRYQSQSCSMVPASGSWRTMHSPSYHRIIGIGCSHSYPYQWMNVFPLRIGLCNSMLLHSTPHPPWLSWLATLTWSPTTAKYHCSCSCR